MGKIKIAVWNICGPARGENYPDSARKINRLQDNINPDIALYLEAPEKNWLGVKSGTWKGKPFWAGTGMEGNPKGILAVCYNENLRIVEEKLSHSTGKTAIGLTVFFGETEILHLLGVWTTPFQDNKTQEIYLDTLKHILADCHESGFLKADAVPCIVAGDTNVNLDSENGQKQNTKEKCIARREPLAKFLNGYGLTLLNHPDIFTHRQYEKDKETKKIIEESQSFFQCDLLMVSNTMLKDSEPPNIEPISLGHSVEHISKEFEKWGSDHLPLFFSYSYDDGSDNKV